MIYRMEEFNRVQSSKIIRGLVVEDDVALINKNGKPIDVVLSNKSYGSQLYKWDKYYRGNWSC